MAVSGADADRINRVLTTTLDRYSPKISNELARNDGVVAVFGARGRIEVVNGGQRAIETLDKSENTNFDFRSIYSDVPTARQDSREEAKYAWATIDGAVTINDVEKAMNQGPTQIHNLLNAEVQNAKNTIVRKVADALRESSPGADEPESVLTIIENNAAASQTGSPGGISKATNTWWRNQYSNTAMDLSSSGGLEALLAFMLQNVSKGNSKNEQPDFGLTTGTLFAALSAGHGDANRRYLGTDATMLKLGFSNIVVMNATIIPDPSISTGDLYLINTNYMGLKVLRTPNMKTIGDNPQTMPVSIRPFMTDPKSLHSISVMSLTFALTCSSCQRQGIATNCS